MSYVEIVFYFTRIESSKKNKRGGILKKTILILLLILVAFMFFGCGQQEQTEGAGSNVSTTGNKNIENSESGSVVTTDNGDKTTEKNDSNTSVDNNQSTEITTDADGQNQTTTKNKMTTNVVETTENTKETFFVVTFKNYNGDILKEEKVKKGEDATAPEPPKRDGYIFVKWDTYYKAVKTDITVNAVYKEITEPTLIVDSVKVNDREAVVKVSTKNNPGLLALLLKINYDENAMTLKKVESGLAMSEYTFTGPKNFKSGCNAAWSTVEVPENVTDGEIAVLYFDVNSQAKKGSYEISVSCYDGAFDKEYEAVKFNVINGSIIIN